MYKVQDGDTFELISRKKYGTETEASNIAKANPGVSEPLTAGTVLIVPPSTSAPQDLQQQAQSATEDEVAILIDGKRFRFWDAVRIIRSIDAMDTVEFSAPFNSDAPDFREIFRPFSYKKVVVTVGGTPLFTGTMIVINPVVENGQKIISISAYSLPGVLNDCTSPASSYPLEFDDQGLKNIATSISLPFGIGVEFQADQGAIFERVASKPGKKTLSFLTDLAKQRKLIVASTTLGKLLFWQSVKVGNPVARLQQGIAPVLSVVPFFNGQEYYSHITGLEPVIIGLDGSQFTVKNPRLESTVRPFTFEVPDTQNSDVKAAVEAKAGRMFGNVVGYSIRVATWRDSSGKLWEPNTTMTLLAPDAMIYKEYEFIIRSVEFERERAAETAILNLVIPGSFDGKIPEVLPWDD